MRTNKPGRKSSIGQNTPSGRAREAIAAKLCSEVQSWHLPQAKAAARLGIHRTNLNRLLQGELSRFALGYLIDMAATAGIQVELTVRDGVSGETGEARPQAMASLFERPPSDQAKLRHVAHCLLEAGDMD